MAHLRATTDMERATLKKAVVSTAPLWAKSERQFWTSLTEEDDDCEHHTDHTANSASSSSSSITAGGLSIHIPKKPTLPRSASYAGSSTVPTWSVFSSMSSVSTVSGRFSRKHRDLKAEAATPASIPSTPEPTQASFGHSVPQSYPQRLQLIFQPNAASAETVVDFSCNCLPSHHACKHRPSSNSKKRAYKHSLEHMRGYPSGQCESSFDPPPITTWDERDLEDVLLIQERRFTLGTNTAFNIEAVKMFLNSPLFANVLKSLTVMTAVSLFAMALDSIIILQKEIAKGGVTPLSDASTTIIVTLVLSILTVVYSCSTIIRESRRLPEGLDSSNSKPLIVIFAEILTSIIWAQILSVTTYIYVWAFGCTSKGKGQLNRLWRQDETPFVVDRLCRRGGTMVGLEVLLVLLLIFNFYTHLAQNFRFIRAVSR